MTKEHKEALAKGRAEGRAVKAYLEALAANKPKRGRKRTSESIQRRLDKIDEALADASALKELQLIQERMDLQTELATIDDKIDISGLEREFVKVAAAYSERKGISYTAWRSVGVTPPVLDKAGIKR